MALTDSEIQSLSDELTNDPDSLGYTDAGGNLKSNAEIKRLINERRADYSVLRPSIPVSEVNANIEWTDEWAGLSQEARDGLRQICAADAVDATSTQIQNALKAIFSETSQTWANLSALANRDASRAENLFGVGTSVTLEDIRRALEV